MYLIERLLTQKMWYICYVQVEILYKLQLVQEICTSCNLYKFWTCTSCNLYKLHICQLRNVFQWIYTLKFIKSTDHESHIPCRLYFFIEKASCGTVYFHNFVDNYNTCLNVYLFLILKVWVTLAHLKPASDFWVGVGNLIIYNNVFCQQFHKIYLFQNKGINKINCFLVILLM